MSEATPMLLASTTRTLVVDDRRATLRAKSQSEHHRSSVIHDASKARSREPDYRARSILTSWHHRAGREITNGNPEVYKSLYSRRNDVTLANPFGPPVRGWSKVSATLDRAVENYRDGEVVGFENIATVITPDLAYAVEIESYRARVGGAEEATPVAVRVTTIFRREDGVWKVVHRHADPITASRTAESVIQR